MIGNVTITLNQTGWNRSLLFNAFYYITLTYEVKNISLINLYFFQHFPGFCECSLSVRKTWVREWKWEKGDDGHILWEHFRCRRWQPWVCVKTRGRKRQGMKSSRSKTTALMSRGGSSYISDGWVKDPTTHGYFQQTQPWRSPSVETFTGPKSHGRMKTQRQSEGSAVCVLFLLFQGGQLCDSRRLHLSSRTLLIRSWQIKQLPFHLSLTTITSQASSGLDSRGLVRFCPKVFCLFHKTVKHIF